APSKVVGVFGMSPSTSREEVLRIFSKYGIIDDFILVTSKTTGESRGFGFIYYDTVDAAGKAVKECNGMLIDGKEIRCDYSVTNKPKEDRSSDRYGRRERERQQSTPASSNLGGNGNVGPS